MKIAIIGIRGIPVTYSGFETFAEELSSRLVKDGYKVVVYCRGSYVDRKQSQFKGVELKVFNTFGGKNFETLIHSLISTLDVLRDKEVKLVYYLGVGSSIFSFLPRLVGKKTLVNVDGLDWRREKWSLVGRQYLLFSEVLAIYFPTKTLTDSQFIKDYYKSKYGKVIEKISYGIDDSFYEMPLEKNERYFLWSGRIVPDNHLDELINAYYKSKISVKLKLVGDDNYDSKYKEKIKKMIANNKNIELLGFVKRSEYYKILINSDLYIETKRSGGTHPSLIEAMGMGCKILCNDHPANKEILRSAGYYYVCASESSLAKQLQELNKHKKEDKTKQLLAQKIAQKNYNWGNIIRKYKNLFSKMDL